MRLTINGTLLFSENLNKPQYKTSKKQYVMALTKTLTNETQSSFHSQKNHFPSNRDFVEARVSHSIMHDCFYIEYSFCSMEDNVSISITDDEGFYFIYCWQGDMAVSLQKRETQNIKQFQSAIIFDAYAEGINLMLKKKISYRFCVIGINKQRSVESFGYTQLKDVFSCHLPKNTQMFIGPPYLKSLEKINDLSHMAKEDITSQLIMKGLVYQILGLKVEQLLAVVNNENRNYNSLTGFEIVRVQVVSDFIRKNPSFDYTVDSLCRETGLSPTKLQDGFKKMHNRTVIDFIRNVRLERSLELIKTTDLNISEIVYSVGLTSRSYFAKIFKNKYKCSPKLFQVQKRTNRLLS